MERLREKLKIGIVIAFLIGGVVGFLGGSAFTVYLDERGEKRIGSGVSPKDTTDVLVEENPTVSYTGEEGKSALELLHEYASYEQEASGLIHIIDGRKADNKRREYWAFYVNGKMAQVGPADYQTKKGDKIEWKIEKY